MTKTFYKSQTSISRFHQCSFCILTTAHWIVVTFCSNMTLFEAVPWSTFPLNLSMLMPRHTLEIQFHSNCNELIPQYHSTTHYWLSCLLCDLKSKNQRRVYTPYLLQIPLAFSSRASENFCWFSWKDLIKSAAATRVEKRQYDQCEIIYINLNLSTPKTTPLYWTNLA